MSRYEWKRDGLVYSIGWDVPMRTYYYQLADENIDDSEADPVIEWLGGNFDEYTDIYRMFDDVWQITLEDIPNEVLLFLEADRTGNLDTVANTILPSFVKKVI